MERDRHGAVTQCVNAGRECVRRTALGESGGEGSSFLGPVSPQFAVTGS